MSVGPRAPFLTPEENAAYEAERQHLLFFEPGKTYTYDFSNTWHSGWSPFRTMSWSVYIRQAEVPWSIIAVESFEYPEAMPFAGLLAKRRAKKWGKDYLKRGGPPEGYWELRR